MSTDRLWAQPVRWTDAISTRTAISMSAGATVRAQLAKDLDVEKIESLAADLKIAPWLDGLEAIGVLHARVTRTCGVSLELFEEAIEEPVALRFVPYGSPNAPPPSEGDVELDLDADDPPECVSGDDIDISYYLAEQLALALNPFPRKPGAEFQPQAMAGSISPFAELARLKSPAPDGDGRS